MKIFGKHFFEVFKKKKVGQRKLCHRFNINQTNVSSLAQIGLCCESTWNSKITVRNFDGAYDVFIQTVWNKTNSDKCGSSAGSYQGL